MFCPFCHAKETKVIDSRLIADGSKIRRRRECLNEHCRARFTTYEIAEDSTPTVIKNDGTRETFNADKLRHGLLRAVEKRPVSDQEITQLINQIEARLRDSGAREIPSKRIGRWVLDGLKDLDHVAYIRFASVYLSFEDVAAFQKTIDELADEQSS
ncbi:transcriptional regulator NrdR [Dichelobacter nodosus]|uniref:Transcriptional repressor NrdR n=1 Tax=Dichelobacter nodosus (strain VCS1703A) TaxID=246195 RepID=A5EVR6_DICNV|nr:transcriptional regulator NrdR [Dichelobacter nodosus]ABQ13080.1 conserved hypothetical protein [Dichelobacter nodosus VCS1703A]AXM45359.1 transcriptional regulator NrdR [Dichelobacter nodosus]KNZ39380.1 NrdR family transcriptional regulator [Dichelobacter nodosus]TGA65027.1 transcriptional regulator NrdR [Dichelobacter nodosus]